MLTRSHRTHPPRRLGRLGAGLAAAVVLSVSVGSVQSGTQAADATTRGGGPDSAACLKAPKERKTKDGVAFLRTPNACFRGLKDWSYTPRYVEIDGLRQAYIDEGPADGDPILLLHGQPSWSYLYRNVIPGLVAKGHRVIAMDHLGMGRSDKPVDTGYYTFDVHAERLDRFIGKLDLQNLTVFAQDWGSVLALWNTASCPDAFDRIVIGNGGMPDEFQPFEIPPADDPQIAAFGQSLRSIPANQPPFYDENGNPVPLPGSSGAGGGGTSAGGGALGSGFGSWTGYAFHSEDFVPSAFVEALTYRDLAPEEEAGYDAPFPSRAYMASPRVFPSLLSDIAGRTAEKRTQLTTYSKPFLTIFGGNEPGIVEQGSQQWMSGSIRGAQGQPHHTYPDASHFLQEDQGPDIARRIDEFIAANPR
ncbi:MAG: haloalkane dehalogenase [Nocardioides sp.]